MAETKVTETELNPSITTDANGWKVYDYGSHKRYIKSGTMSVVITSLGFNGGSLGNNLPVGITNLGGVDFVNICLRANDNALAVTPSTYTAATTAISYRVQNAYAGSVTLNGQWTIELVK